jgi:hypothetical protein
MADLQKRLASVWPHGKVSGWFIKGRIRCECWTAPTVARSHDMSRLMSSDQLDRPEGRLDAVENEFSVGHSLDRSF